MEHDKDNQSPAFQAFYIESLLYITFNAIQAFEAFSAGITEYSKIPSREDYEKFNFDTILDPVHHIVTAGSALRGYFWPLKSTDESEPRAHFLRETLGVGEESPLFTQRLQGLNDRFHLKIDDYLAEKPTGQIVPRHVGSLADKKTEDGRDIHLFRGYDPEVGEFEVLGVRYQIEPLTHEIIRIHNQLLEAQKRGYKFTEE